MQHFVWESVLQWYFIFQAQGHVLDYLTNASDHHRISSSNHPILQTKQQGMDFQLGHIQFWNCQFFHKSPKKHTHTKKKKTAILPLLTSGPKKSLLPKIPPFPENCCQQHIFQNLLQLLKSLCRLHFCGIDPRIFAILPSGRWVRGRWEG